MAELAQAEEQASGALHADTKERDRLASALATASSRARLSACVLKRTEDECSQAEAEEAERERAEQFEATMQPIRELFDKRAELAKELTADIDRFCATYVELARTTDQIWGSMPSKTKREIAHMLPAWKNLDMGANVSRHIVAKTSGLLLTYISDGGPVFDLGEMAEQARGVILSALGDRVADSDSQPPEEVTSDRELEELMLLLETPSQQPEGDADEAA